VLAVPAGPQPLPHDTLSMPTRHGPSSRTSNGQVVVERQGHGPHRSSSLRCCTRSSFSDCFSDRRSSSSASTSTCPNQHGLCCIGTAEPLWLNLAGHTMHTGCQYLGCLNVLVTALRCPHITHTHVMSVHHGANTSSHAPSTQLNRNTDTPTHTTPTVAHHKYCYKSLLTGCSPGHVSRSMYVAGWVLGMFGASPYLGACMAHTML
jgi:hypothetical protein